MVVVVAVAAAAPGESAVAGARPVSSDSPGATKLRRPFGRAAPFDEHGAAVERAVHKHPAAADECAAGETVRVTDREPGRAGFDKFHRAAQLAGAREREIFCRVNRDLRRRERSAKQNRRVV